MLSLRCPRLVFVLDLNGLSLGVGAVIEMLQRPLVALYCIAQSPSTVAAHLYHISEGCIGCPSKSLNLLNTTLYPSFLVNVIFILSILCSTKLTGGEGRGSDDRWKNEPTDLSCDRRTQWAQCQSELSWMRIKCESGIFTLYLHSEMRKTWCMIGW